MISRTIKSVYLDKEGIRVLYLLFIQALFIGFFMGSFEITAQTLFLEKFTSKKLPLAFLFSGAAGIVLMYLYFFLRDRTLPRMMGILNILVITIIVGIIMLFYNISGDILYIFVSFILMFPFFVLLLKGFRDTVAGTFKPFQVHRLEGFLHSGQITGIIIIALLIPFLVNHGFKINTGLSISLFSMIAALLIQLYIFRRDKKNLNNSNSKEYNELEKPGFSDILSQRYTLLISGFVALSLVILVFITFSFLSLSEIRYDDSQSLASFFGFFLAGFILLSLSLEKYVYPSLLKNFGLKILLLIAPLLLLAFIGLMDITWKNPDIAKVTADFSTVFLFAILAMLFSRSFRESFELPIIRILLQPLKIPERRQFTEMFQRMVREPMVLFSGLILLTLTSFGLSILQINYLLLFLVGGWIYLAYLIYNHYRSALQKTLKQIRQPAIPGIKKEKNIFEKVNQEKSPTNIKWLLEFAPQAWNGYISDNLQDLLKSNDPETRELTLDWIERLNIAESRNALIYMEQSMEERKRLRIRTLIDRYNHITPVPDRALIESKMTSIKWEDRLFSITALLKKPELLKHGILRPLLKDNDFQVRISAIRLIGVFKLIEYAPDLIQLLNDKQYYAFAWNSLNQMSSEILPALDKVFSKPDSSRNTMDRVIRLIASSTSEEKVNFLVGKLNRKEDYILRTVLKSLAASDFRPYEQTRSRLKIILENYIGMAAWNLAVLESSRYSKLNSELVRAIELEYKRSYRMIFLILSVLYGRKTMEEIQKNIETGTTESIGYSIELMDLFIDEDIKEGLFIFLEAGRKTNGIKKLKTSFPVTFYRGEDLLHAIINRDYNYLNTFTRVLAIKELEKIKDYNVGETLIAQLFNPDEIVAETSVQQVIKHDPDILADVIPRLPDERREQIINILERKTPKRFGDSLETFRYLKRCLHNSDELNDFILFDLAMEFRSFQVKGGQGFELTEHFGETEFILAGTADFTASSGNIEIKSFVKDELSLVKVKADSPEKNLVVKSPKSLKLIVLPLKSLRELIFDNEDEFFTLLPAMFRKPKAPASSLK